MLTSRDPTLLHPALQERFKWMLKEWRLRYPLDSQPILTCSFRDEEAQNAAKAGALAA